MNKGIVLGVVFLFVMMSFTSISGNQINNQINKLSFMGNTFYVGGSEPGNYSSIQDAINDANNGDTVYVYNGTYWGNIVVNKSINLIGECKDTTYIEWYSSIDVVINISADWVYISGFSIPWGEYNAVGIYSDYNTFSGNNINYLDIGIEINSNYNIISDNNISNCNNGIILKNSSIGNSILDNNISSSRECSLWLDSSNNNTIMGNIISWNDMQGLRVRDSHNNTISDNIISWTQFGFDVSYSHDNSIINNYFENNTHDLALLHNSNNNTVSGNTFLDTHCCRSIRIDNSSYNHFDNNIIRNGGINAINICDNSNNNIITGNIISRTKGFHRDGIIIWYSCCNNKIINNTFIRNRYGIYIEEFSDNNSIYRNNFINNSVKDEGNNTWDDGRYGNYWSDYKDRYLNAKPKLFKPWMWNTPYEIYGGNNRDDCPLVKQWPNSASKDIPRNRVNYKSLFLRFLERFPMLQRLLDVWRLNNL